MVTVEGVCNRRHSNAHLLGCGALACVRHPSSKSAEFLLKNRIVLCVEHISRIVSARHFH
jgi:hypothetical protein